MNDMVDSRKQQTIDALKAAMDDAAESSGGCGSVRDSARRVARYIESLGRPGVVLVCAGDIGDAWVSELAPQMRAVSLHHWRISTSWDLNVLRRRVQEQSLRHRAEDGKASLVVVSDQEVLQGELKNEVDVMVSKDPDSGELMIDTFAHPGDQCKTEVSVASDNLGDLNFTQFAHQVRSVCSEVADLLVTKNAAYGNSALDPVRCFSKANPVEQLKVRIDDKISRLMRGHSLPDETLRDTRRDLMGYLVLLEVAERIWKEEAK